MKSTIIRAIIILSLIQTYIGASSIFSQSQFVTLLNGGFESDPTNDNNGWIWPENDWLWDGDVAHGGTHSVRVIRSSSRATDSLYSVNIPIQESTIYSLTYWLRTQNADFWPSVSIYQYTNEHIRTGLRLIAHANIASGSSDWSQVTYRFQTMPNASMINLRIYLPIAYGSFWFDDFGLEEIQPAIFPYHQGFPVLASGSIFYSSPVVVDIDKDGRKELIIAGGNAVDGWDRDGIPLQNFPLITGDKHIQSQIAVADMDGDGNLELSAGTKTAVYQGQGRVFLWNHTGGIVAGWPKTVDWNSQYANNESLVGTIVLADINNDHKFEVLAGTSNNTARYSGSNPPPSPNLYAWNATGSLIDGEWPTWHNTAGIYGFLAAGDLNGDGIVDIEVGRDHHFLNTYDTNGISLPGWPVETYLYGESGRYDIDEHIDYSHGAPVIADLDRDGEMEYIISGFVGGPGSLPLNNSALLVMQPDGTRRQNWQTPALGNGLLNLYDRSTEAPAIADIDNDGQLEIIITTNDGWIRAYKPDKTILWEFNFTQGDVLVATEPVIGDIDGDGSFEILFGTRVPSREQGLYYSGPVGLWALESNGVVMPGFPLPVPTPGMFGAPTLADLDDDGKLEILAASREGEVLVWNTSTNYNPSRLPWPTSRHDLRRSATYTTLIPLEASQISALPSYVGYGDTVSFTVRITSIERLADPILLTNTIPPGLTFIPETLVASSGVVTEDENIIHWNGYIPDSLSVEISYDVLVTTSAPQIIQNTAKISTDSSESLERSANIHVNYSQVLLPILIR